MPGWQLPQMGDSPKELIEFTGDPLLAQLLVQRGHRTVAQAGAFLDAGSYQPASPFELPDLEVAAARLSRAITRQEVICIWGDFDADGQTATALLVSALAELGAQVRYYIPDRLTESHGIKLAALERLLAEGIDLILTCDTGIADHQAIAAARAAGVAVIVTDHHDLADPLPPANAIVNPKRLLPEHPLHELPGVGVAYKVIEGLYETLGRPTHDDTLLDLVALGIVADIAQQTGDTRYLLQRGLAALQQTSRVGLQAVIENANLKTDHLTEEHIGFWLAPRLNALGRLGDAKLGVELLNTTDRTRARIIALQLEALNDRRKLLVDRVVVQALSQLEDNPSLAAYNAIVLAATDWHPGVIGIAASRLVEQYGKPAILIALRPDGQGRGSARSVPGCNIHQALKSQADLLTSFGGHPLAAGLAIPPPNISTFRRGLSAALADCQADVETSLALDLVVDLPQVSIALLNTIQRLAPFGAGNPPVFIGCHGLKIVAETTFGKARDHKRLVVEDDNGWRQEVIWWRGAAEPSPQGLFDLAFTLSPDDFKGGEAVQLDWVAAQTWTAAPIVRPAEFVDWRHQTDISALLSGVERSDQESVLLWSESPDPTALPPVSRYGLQPAETLIIWTAPPGQDIFQQALTAVKPQQIIIVGRPSPFDAWPALVKQLMGLLKYAVKYKEGEVVLEELAGALAQRVTTVRLGIDWLVARGKLTLVADEDEVLVVQLDQRPPAPEAATIEEILKSALAETRAYRQFFREASLVSLRRAIAASTR